MRQSRPQRESLIRTCIATRTRHPESELLRVALDPKDPSRSVVLADPARRLPGRGAWLVPTLEAFKLAEDKRAFGRALRASATVDTTKVREYLEILLRPDAAADTAMAAGRTDEIVRKT